MATIETGQVRSIRLLSCHEIPPIAQDDAASSYRDLSDYRITLLLQPDGWHVDYDLTEPYLAGGGPHYIIDPTSGAILWKTYEQ
jgi:hypothetical protein